MAIVDGFSPAMNKKIIVVKAPILIQKTIIKKQVIVEILMILGDLMKVDEYFTDAKTLDQSDSRIRAIIREELLLIIEALKEKIEELDEPKEKKEVIILSKLSDLPASDNWEDYKRILKSGDFQKKDFTFNCKSLEDLNTIGQGLDKGGALKGFHRIKILLNIDNSVYLKIPLTDHNTNFEIKKGDLLKVNYYRKSKYYSKLSSDTRDTQIEHTEIWAFSNQITILEQ